jgi:hypothetical protein
MEIYRGNAANIWHDRPETQESSTRCQSEDIREWGRDPIWTWCISLMLAESLIYPAVYTRPDYQSDCRHKTAWIFLIYVQEIRFRPRMTVSYIESSTLITNIGKFVSNCKHHYLSHLFGKYCGLKQSNDYGYKENMFGLPLCLRYRLCVRTWLIKYVESKHLSWSQ